jgi:hypothetical protein
VTWAMLDHAAKVLGPVAADVVFVGGAVIVAWVTDPAAPAPRPTLDVDVVVEVATLAQRMRFDQRLRDRGLSEDVEGGVICRWKHPPTTLVLDVMPVDAGVFGFGNGWSAEAMRTAHRLRSPSGAELAVVAPEVLLAMKLEAFESRGNGDYYGSRDFADIVSLVDGRVELVDDVRRAASALREFVATELRRHLARQRAVDGIYGALQGDAASQARAGEIVLPRMQVLAGGA